MLISTLRRFDMRSLPIHVLVGSSEARRKPQGIVSHVWSGKLIAGSFLELKPEIYVSSPEFCFLQMARHLDFVDLVRFGYELCASYRPVRGSVEGIEESEPLSTPRKLMSFLSRAKGVYGANHALSAARWVRGGSRSPRETALSMILSLPTRYGGYQLGLPDLNYQIPVGFDVEGMLNRYIDLYWKSARVGLEYESNTFHTGVAKITHDSVREKVLIERGVKMFRVTHDELVDPLKLDLLVTVLARALGKRIRSRSSEIQRRRRALAASLLQKGDTWKTFSEGEVASKWGL